MTTSLPTGLTDLWKSWSEPLRLTLHGALWFVQEEPFLAVSAYPGLLGASMAEAASARRLLFLSESWEKFLKGLGGTSAETATLRFALPEVAPGVPLPAPRALSGRLGLQESSRLAKLLSGNEMRGNGIDLPAALLPFSALHLAIPALHSIESQHPGSLTPPFATLVSSLRELEAELREVWNTHRTEIPGKLLSAINGKLPWPQIPSWEEFLQDFSFSGERSQTVANLPFARCRSWQIRLAAENRACVTSVPSDTRAWARVVVMGAVFLSRSFEKAPVEAGTKSVSEAPPGLPLFIADMLPGRPLRPLCAIACEPAGDASGMARVTLAAFRSEALEGSAAQVQKKMLEPQSLLRLSELMDTDATSEPSFAWNAAGSPVPGFRFFSLADMLRALEEFPEWFLNPAIAFKGELRLGRDGVSALEATFEARTADSKGKRFLRCRTLQETQENLLPFFPATSPLLAGGSGKGAPWWRREGSEPTPPCGTWLQMAWLDSSETTSIRIQIELSPTDEDHARFSARAFLEIDGTELTREQWLSAKKARSGYVLPSGRLVPAQTYRKVSDLLERREQAFREGGALEAASLWQAQLAGTRNMASSHPEEWLAHLELRLSAQARERLLQLQEKSLAVVDRMLSPGLAGTLRPYQREGVATLHATLAQGLNPCLADEMGLGKTLQTISLLTILSQENPGMKTLIVVPKSVLVNWKREWERFAPETEVAEWGSAAAASATIVLVTYTRARIDVESLCATPWLACVLDEAHTIKNHETQTAAAMRKIPSKYRMAITGTPLENRAEELWNLVDWLNPGFLGPAADFSAYANMARASQEKRLLLRPLHAALEPIMLRRTKSDPRVALNLPDKIFEEHLFELSSEQSRLYRAVMEKVAASPCDDTPQGRFQILQALVQLKQICNHPASLPSSAGRSQDFSSLLEFHVECSAKVAALVELLEKVRQQSVGVVIFTQFVAMGRILLDLLGLIDETHWRDAWFLHGGLSAEERQSMVETFSRECRNRGAQEKGVAPVLVASLKAGGLGLNLTDADTVIHFDRWWNPAVEDQATDRLHRMGQKRSVGVHLFTGIGTLEESIARLMTEKRSLAQDLLGVATSENLGDLVADKEQLMRLMDPAGRFSAPATTTLGEAP